MTTTRLIRTSLTILAAITFSFALLTLRPGATAGAHAAGDELAGAADLAYAGSQGAADGFQVVAVGGGAWVVLDSRTGTMERWSPDQYGFVVNRMSFKGASVATRRLHAGR